MTDKFIPSQTKQIHFADGKVLAMNRKERRANKLYNKMMTPFVEQKKEEESKIKLIPGKPIVKE